MARACKRLLQNEDQRLAMGEAGRAYASKKFGAQGIALAYMVVYSEDKKAKEIIVLKVTPHNYKEVM